MDVTKHQLVPKHTKLSESDRKKILEKYNIATKQLPKIIISDPAIGALKAKIGDIIKVSRPSNTAGIAYYYRVVIDD